MDSKELVQKLLAGGLPIKNYMSTLDEEAVTRARDLISGAVSEVVEEKRVKPTVIRRRRKVVRVEAEIQETPPPAEAVEEAPVEPAPPPPPETEERVAEVPEGIEPASHALEVEEAEAVEPAGESPVPETPAVEEPAPEPAPGKAEVKPEAKPKRKKGKKKRGDEPAKIIRRPEEGPLRHILAKGAQPPAAPKAPAEPKPKIAPAPPPPKAPVRKPAEIMAEVIKKAEKPKPAKKKREKKRPEKEPLAQKGVPRQRRKEVIEQADLYQDRGFRSRGKKALERSREAARKQKRTEITTPKAIKRRIKVQEAVTVAELAKAMGIKATELIRALMKMGMMANINQSIDFETATLIADEWGYELELDTFEEDRLLAEGEDKEEDLEPRPPVVTIMGHVDHGKTSLLDYIRKSNIIEGESGGITQHIGAYYVQTDGGDIVFLDTPGHEAFTAMRARGAKVTDIIVLVVAADDGVMPQTREAINHARAAEIPIVVAVNKMDKPQANPDKVKRELAELDLAPEEWGGETIYGYVSALTGEGVDDLLGLILLQAEILELRGNPHKPARGTIIEAKLDRSKGPVATVLIRNGTLKQGDAFICGQQHGKVRAMTDHKGRRMISAGPSRPVEIYGISGVPMAGDEFVVVEAEKTAKQIVEHRVARTREQDVASRNIVSLDDLFERIKEGEVKELNIVLKADVQGSLEALSDALGKLSTEEVKLKIIHAATGAITESDVMLAAASGAIIIGFNVRANPRVTEVAEKETVDIRYYDVIYNVIKDVRAAMTGLLEPVLKEQVIGRAEIKEVFHVPRVGAVAGCYVTNGRVERNARVRVLRDEVVAFDGKVASLRRYKEDVKEVQAGYECGIGIENFQDIKPGDIFEIYQVEEVQAEL